MLVNDPSKLPYRRADTSTGALGQYQIRLVTIVRASLSRAAPGAPFGSLIASLQSSSSRCAASKLIDEIKIERIRLAGFDASSLRARFRRGILLWQ